MRLCPCGASSSQQRTPNPSRQRGRKRPAYQHPDQDLPSQTGRLSTSMVRKDRRQNVLLGRQFPLVTRDIALADQEGQLCDKS